MEVICAQKYLNFMLFSIGTLTTTKQLRSMGVLSQSSISSVSSFSNPEISEVLGSKSGPGLQSSSVFVDNWLLLFLNEIKGTSESEDSSSAGKFFFVFS